MDDRKYIIYMKDHGMWVDKTSSIDDFSFDGRMWNVKFTRSSNNYTYAFDKIALYKFSKIIDAVSVEYKGKGYYNVEVIEYLGEFQTGKAYRIYLKGKNIITANAHEINITTNTLSESDDAFRVMEYYKSIVKEISTLDLKPIESDDNDDTQNDENAFLAKQFEKIDCVNSNSVLDLYLNRKLGVVESRKESLPTICPFGLNLSQAKALNMAFINRISIIEGPPGTGKTQTILNIVSNAVIRKKSVAIVSNNNSATSNVYEKLQKYGFDFICAPLGKSENVDLFFENYNPAIPKMEKEDVDEDELRKMYMNLPLYFEKEDRKRILRSTTEATKLEYSHFVEDNKSFDFNEYIIKRKNLTSQYIQSVIIKLKEKNKLGFFERRSIKRKLKAKGKLFKEDRDKALVYLENYYYLAKISESENEIKQIEA